MQTKFHLRRLIIGLTLILYAGIGYSQQQYAAIYLKNGDRLTGEWLGANDRSARIRYAGQELSIELNRISNIRYATDISLIPDALAEKYFRNGEALLELGLREDAKASFRAAIKEFPKYADAHRQLGLLLQAEGKNDEALKYFGNVVTINPDAQDMSGVFKQVGDAYLNTSEYQKAADAYLLLFKHYPEHPNAESAGYTAGFLLAEQLNDFEGALAILQEVAGRFPNSSQREKANYLIGALQLRIGLAAEAVDTLSLFIQEYPRSEWLDDAYLARGNAYLQRRQNRDALADFQYVQKISNDPQVRLQAQKKRATTAWMVYTVSDGLPSNRVQALALDGNGNILWVGTDKGLIKVDVGMGLWQTMPSIANFINTDFAENDEPVNVRALAVDSQEVWIGTLNNGVIRYNKATESFDNYNSRYGLPHNTVYDIKISGEQVWVGTFSGIARYDRTADTWTKYQKNDGLPAANIVSLALTPKTVWVGTSEAGIGIFDREIRQWRTYGTFDGLDPKVGKSIVDFAVAGEKVFFTWYNRANRSNGFGTADWLGSNSEAFPVIEFGDIVPPEDIYIAVDRAGAETSPNVWIATNDQVLIRRSQGWDYVEYPIDRLGDVKVTGIAVGGGMTWIGTSSGLARIAAGALVAPEE